MEPHGRWETTQRHALAMNYMNRGNAKQDASRYGPSAALPDYEAAIRLLENLRDELKPLGVWETPLRNDLAAAYMNRGIAKHHASSYGPSAAIPNYDAAICIWEDLRDELNPHGRWDTTLRNNLGKGYVDRGVAKQHASGYGHSAALPDYDAAIRIWEDLRDELKPLGRWETTLRNDLAAAYMNRGNAKQDASGSGPSAALPDYDKAIRIREDLRDELKPLGRWETTLRNDLAAAYMNRGNAKQGASGYGPSAALPDYDAAIRIREDLRDELKPLGYWETTLRNDLAMVYMNRGKAKQDASDYGPRAALPDHDAAIELAGALPAGVLPYLELRLTSLCNAADCRLLLDKRDADEEANDQAESACDLARMTESTVGTHFRWLREWAFGLCLQSYQSVSPGFLAEFALEHLDPINPGAAPDSLDMLANAQTQIGQLLLHPDLEAHPDWKASAALALNRLNLIEALYHGDTPEATRRRADLLLNRDKNPEAAEAELKAYTLRHKFDPDGWLNLAGFRAERDQPDTALETLDDALTLVLDQGMEADSSAALVKLKAMLELGATIHIRASSSGGRDARNRMLRQCDQAQAWLHRFNDQIPAYLIANKQNPLDEVTNRIARERELWLDAYQWNQTQDLLASLDKRWEPFLNQVKAALAHHLPRTWQQFIVDLLEALDTSWKSLLASAAGQEFDDEILAEALVHRLGQAFERLADSQTTEARTSLASLLGEIWSALSPREQAHLATAYRLMEEGGFDNFAALGFSMTLEHALRERLYAPLIKTLLQQGGIDLQPLPGDNMDTSLANFLRGKLPHLMLGPLLIGFQRAQSDSNSQSAALLRQYIAQWPSAHLILESTEAQRKTRARELNFVVDQRNNCAHQKTEVTRDAVQRIWGAVVADQRDAFLRYFVGGQIN